MMMENSEAGIVIYVRLNKGGSISFFADPQGTQSVVWTFPLACALTICPFDADTKENLKSIKFSFKGITKNSGSSPFRGAPGSSSYTWRENQPTVTLIDQNGKWEWHTMPACLDCNVEYVLPEFQVGDGGGAEES